MSTIRIIPRLDIKGANLVKGIHLEGLRVLGDPDYFANHYYQQGADEIFYMDVVASLYERNSLKDMIKKTSENVFIPITVGGGIRTIKDIQTALQNGADKICMNTAAVKNPEIIREASREFGSSTIVIALEATKKANGQYELLMDNARETTGLEALSWSKKVEDLGAGEIVLTSVDKEGTGEGFDIDLIRQVSSQLSIPVIAHGGASSPENIAEAIKAGAKAVAISSILHYEAIKNMNTENIDQKNDSEGNKSFLKSGANFSKIKTSSIPEIKRYLTSVGIDCRV